MNDGVAGNAPVAFVRDLPAHIARAAHSDDAGVPTIGRSAELAALREVGRRNPTSGRIFEGHVNGAQLVARYGTDRQRERLRHDLEAGHLFGVWNTQDSDRLRMEPNGDSYVLRGAKTWASGAGTVTRGLVTAALPDGRLQMLVVPMDRVHATIDRSSWAPMGMQDSDSFKVGFDGIVVSPDELIGSPGDYELQPWFSGGALRFLAAHTGIIERLENELISYLLEHNRHTDTLQQTRVAHVRTAVRTSNYWLEAGAAAWTQFDTDSSQENANSVMDVVDMARVVIERAALDVSELVIRSVGARGLVEPLPFGRLVRDLQMYLRQPAPDAALLRVADRAFTAAAASRSAAIASPTGTNG